MFKNKESPCIFLYKMKTNGAITVVEWKQMYKEIETKTFKMRFESTKLVRFISKIILKSS